MCNVKFTFGLYQVRENHAIMFSLYIKVTKLTALLLGVTIVTNSAELSNVSAIPRVVGRGHKINNIICFYLRVSWRV